MIWFITCLLFAVHRPEPEPEVEQPQPSPSEEAEAEETQALVNGEKETEGEIRHRPWCQLQSGYTVPFVRCLFKDYILHLILEHTQIYFKQTLWRYFLMNGIQIIVKYLWPLYIGFGVTRFFSYSSHFVYISWFRWIKTYTKCVMLHLWW